MRAHLLIPLFFLFLFGFNANSITHQSQQDEGPETEVEGSLVKLHNYVFSDSIDEAEETFQSIKYKLKEDGTDFDSLTPIYGKVINERFSHLYFLNALICQSKKQESEYKSLLNKSLEFYPQNVPALVYRAEEYIGEGKYKEALIDINNAIKIEPLNSTALTFRGKIESHYERFDEAIFYYTKSLAIDPTNISTRFNRACAYLMLQQYENLILDSFECMSSEKYMSLINEMLIHCHQSSPQIFDQTFQNEIQKYKEPDMDKSISLLYLHLEIMSNAGNPKKSLADIEQLITFGIDDTPDIYFLRGLVYNDMRQFDKVQENMKLALELNPYFADAYIKLGQVKFLKK